MNIKIDTESSAARELASILADLVSSYARRGAAMGLAYTGLGLYKVSRLLVQASRHIIAEQARASTAHMTPDAREQMIQTVAKRRGVDPDHLRRVCDILLAEGKS